MTTWTPQNGDAPTWLPSLHWVVETELWDDEAFWLDDEIWEDGPFWSEQ